MKRKNMIEENKELFELMLELEDIEEVGEIGYANTYDISVTGNHTFLLSTGIISHNSAQSGLLPGLGRKGIGYYELKGKPMNVYEASTQKFTSNKELTELYQIIQNENYENIAIASDADLDGIAINGLLLAFFNRYLKEYLQEGKIYRLQTPVMALLDKKKMPVEWIYDLKGSIDKKHGLTFKYFKGLGGYTPDQLKKIIEIDGMQKMLLPLTYDDETEKSIQDWYSSSKADVRKEKIMANDFDLIKI
jgi:DNA gyrase/topoisomerase IV subunit B